MIKISDFSSYTYFMHLKEHIDSLAYGVVVVQYEIQFSLILVNLWMAGGARLGCHVDNALCGKRGTQ